jgi:hypothetical protein
MSALPFIGLPLERPGGWNARTRSRVRPGDPSLPSEEAWAELGRRLGGQLIKVVSPLSACMGASPSEACAYLAKELKDPYYLGDEVG